MRVCVLAANGFSFTFPAGRARDRTVGVATEEEDVCKESLVVVSLVIDHSSVGHSTGSCAQSSTSMGSSMTWHIR